MHQPIFVHPLGRVKALAWVFNVTPPEVGGDGFTVNNGGFDPEEPFRQRIVASYRQILDVSNWDRSLVIHTTGQSGLPFHKHYRDFAPLWARGEYVPLLFSRSAVDGAAAERLIMHSRAQLALFRPGPEVTALRELFSELVTDPDIVRRLSDLLSGAENRYVTSADAHPLAGHWVPDFAVANAGGIRRMAEVARDGRPLVVDLTDGGEVAAALVDKDDRLTTLANRDMRGHTTISRKSGDVATAQFAAAPVRTPASGKPTVAFDPLAPENR